jgi:ribosomal protein S18 acetylase RimI-like enzyme
MTRRSDPELPGDVPRAAAPGTAQSLGTGRHAGGSRNPVERASARPGVTVRAATLGDLPTIVDLRLALLRENADHPVYGHLRADARERAYDVFGAQLRSAHEVMFLAEARGAVVGILRCVETLNSPLLYPERYCYVSSVYVRPASRRAGVLKALLARAREWCGERGLREMRLHNVPGGSASAAWSASGFGVMEEVRRKDLR